MGHCFGPTVNLGEGDDLNPKLIRWGVGWCRYWVGAVVAGQSAWISVP